MKKFNITVNGKAYEVEVEEVGGAPSAPRAAAPRPAAPAPTAAPKAAPAPAAKAAPAPVVEGGEQIVAPMPGTVLDIKVNVGDTVNQNDVVVVLEAMKMENEICAQSAGKVLSIVASKGASVNSGDVLVVIG